MTAPADPTPRAFVPVWLSPVDVSGWLRMAGGPAADTELVRQVCAAVEPQVQAARPDRWSIVDPDADPPEVSTYVPDGEVYQAAVQLAARVVRRRNSPGGIETFGESVIYAAQYDPEVQRALRQGPWRRHAVG